ncbi:MAG: non-ribosomal peptide synthase [Candidatus Dadabacteria bacterium]|nr:non-ribosomal peptide synthase [Candidatus Dadabacteria bacterium]NIS07227.1 non-ribosomal peptide synthase [Candidatus Dadabacteria bacterium]NIV40934.1 non-ribosomal peptide synthase [Candidatus Dadabacteria bacterium]NIX14366.1 non-ribosomal peptide synthase [Candidatus Dadabacteria bacterium]NIY20884.1 non-ribosomal peptide synthase [Candidatus Dadabacteria bacterium]
MSTLADLDLKTIMSLTGIPAQKDLVNPKEPLEMAKKVRVTFRPLPDGYNNKEIIKFREALQQKLVECGVENLSWEESTEKPTGSFINRAIVGRRVKRNVHAVIDLKREYSIIRKAFSSFAEFVYGMMRDPERSVMGILKISGWADNFTARWLADPYNTQVVTLKSLDSEFIDKETPYDRKIVIGLQDLISTMSEIVIGISGDKFSIVNMNLSDSSYTHEEIDDFIKKSFIPKIYAPIKPPVLNRFIQSEYDPQSSEFVKRLAELGKELKKTDLFPHGSKFSDKIPRQSHRDVVEKILEGRTGVSYGFIALVESPGYEGKKLITPQKWAKLSEIKNVNKEYVREDSGGRWYIKSVIRGKTIYQQLPDIWICTSRSGSDKTNLDPKSDIVRVGLIKGKLYLQTPMGVDLKRRDIRPSFDTYVILAQALSCALYTPEIIEDGMPIVHFHGYPDPQWFSDNEYHIGAQNPSMPCGTIEAALLNFAGVYDIVNENGQTMNLLCLVESDHGVNILGPRTQYLVERLMEGSLSGDIMLGGRFLPELKKVGA